MNKETLMTMDSKIWHLWSWTSRADKKHQMRCTQVFIGTPPRANIKLVDGESFQGMQICSRCLGK